MDDVVGVADADGAVDVENTEEVAEVDVAVEPEDELGAALELEEDADTDEDDTAEVEVAGVVDEVEVNEVGVEVVEVVRARKTTHAALCCMLQALGLKRAQHCVP